MKKKAPGLTRTALAPENIMRVREPLIRSPRRSACKLYRELRLSSESGYNLTDRLNISSLQAVYGSETAKRRL